MIRLLRIFCAAILSCAVWACSESAEEKAEITHSPRISEILADDTVCPWHGNTIEAPDGGLRMSFRPLGPLKRAFNDSNYIQIGAARALGIKPIQSDADIWNLERPLVRIQSCPEYYLDDLTHSYPYLVPEAAQLLDDIGRAFNDSLAARGGGRYRIKVTSVLRTPVTVKSLQRVNRNATSESTHIYGTTFDISHAKFICDGTDQPARTFEDLKNLLAEVLDDLRRQGRCYVIFEAKQSCFHVTARPADGIEYPAPKPEPPKRTSVKKPRRRK